MKRIANFILYKLMGWQKKGEIPKDLKKYVLIAAPHTSNWDFVYAKLYFWAAGIPVKIPIKSDLFFFPLGPILKAMGGIPVNRKKSTNLTSAIAQMFKERDELVLVITPEGTRSYAPEWKKGFYYIAQEANVPIVLGYIDFKTKTTGIGPVFKPTGNVEKDLEEIVNFYKQFEGKYQSGANLQSYLHE